MGRRWPIVLGLALLVGIAAGAADTPTFQELEESLTCQCGCGLTVHSCNHLQCGSALPLREEIRQQMTAGKGKEEILSYFADKYGEKILSAPTARGFNVAAWVMPFVVLAAGGIFVGTAVARWTRRSRPAAPSGPEPPPAPREYRDILDRELERFGE